MPRVCRRKPHPGMHQPPEPLMLPTESPCSLIFDLTLSPKALNPAIAISATRPTMMMYSTMFAPRVSRRRDDIWIRLMCFMFDILCRSDCELGESWIDSGDRV